MSAIDAAKRIADKNNYTFVLTYFRMMTLGKLHLGIMLIALKIVAAIQLIVLVLRFLNLWDDYEC